jgi:glycosidase
MRSIGTTAAMMLSAGLALAGVASDLFAQATTNPTLPRRDAAKPRPKPTGPDRAGWWNDAVFYQIFVRSFADSTTGPLANDGIGDFRGIIDHLDYLNDNNPATTSDLGITGLWLMPIHPSPSYHGYDVVDYKGINPQYGTMDDFREFIRESHKRGIRVILDLVLNHSSSEHPFFLESQKPNSPKRDWYLWNDAKPAWKGPWGQEVWHKKGDSYFYGIFSTVMPDVNYRNPEASKAFLDFVRFWLKEENVDGYRLDAIRHLIENGAQQDNTEDTHEWLRNFQKFYRNVRPDAYTIGEVWASSEEASPYVPDQMDHVFEFDLAGAMTRSAREEAAAAVRGQQRRVLELYPPNSYGRFLSNHDQVRIATVLQQNQGQLKAAAGMLLTGPGTPYIYYGEEIGMTGDKPDELIRKPMQWSSAPQAGFTKGTPWQELNPGWESQNVQAQQRDPGSLWNVYANLIRARNASPALQWGSYIPVTVDQPEVYAFLRHAQSPATKDRPAVNQTALVLVNLAPETIGDYALTFESSPLRGRLKSTEIAQRVWSQPPRVNERGGTITPSRPLAELAPNTTYVIILDESPAAR